MSQPITVSTFYSFVPLADAASLRTPILERMRALGIRGTITLASEGINATISGAAEAIEALMEFLKTHITFTTPTFRESHFAAQPFARTKVKVKRELISLGVPTNPAQCVGTYVQPKDWNALITSPDVILIDTRNAYEFELGHFKGALNPATRNFKQMVAWTQAHLIPSPRGGGLGWGHSDRLVGSVALDNPQSARSTPLPASPLWGEGRRRIAMYCTGGIRCDKYSSYLVSLGFADVLHLHGGILAYLEQIPEHESLWIGDCFVFDERVGVRHGLVPMAVAA
jgi:UPF0176 protein